MLDTQKRGDRLKDEPKYFESIGKRLESGRYWCTTCQTGCDATEDGRCLNCIGRGRTTILFIKSVTEPKENNKDVTSVTDVVKEEVKEVVKKVSKVSMKKKS